MRRKKKQIRTVEEWNRVVEEAERSGEPFEQVTTLHDMTLSEADAKKLYGTAWKQGIPQEGTPPFVQPDSPGQRRKH